MMGFFCTGQRRSRLLVLGVAGLVVFAPASATGARSSSPGNAAGPAAHCVVRVQPVGLDGVSPPAGPETCFRTFRQAIENATSGRVKDAPLSGAAISEQALAPDSAAAEYVIGIDYEGANYTGITLTWVAAAPCSATVSYVANMDAAWNNRVSSAHSYANCARYRHWENFNWGGSGGSSILCTCATMGVMDNATSSESWKSN
jgi:hypothetical protein